MIMAIRRIAVEEAFVTPEIVVQWHVVLDGKNVEPGFAKTGETILAQTPANKPLDDRLLDIGAGRIAHMDEIGIDVQVLSFTSPGVQVFDGPLATRLGTTAGVTSMPALRLSLDDLGVERILFAADFPYEDDAEAVRFMDGAKGTEDERKQIYETNAVRVFKLKA